VAAKLRVSLGLVGAIALLAAFAANAARADAPSDRFCNRNSARVFLPWNDHAFYMLAPGGSFEPRAPDWSLTGQARVVTGNEPFHIGSPDDKRALSIPAGSSATSPPMCFSPGDWHFRFVGGGNGRVHVTVRVQGLLGVLSILDGGTVTTNGTWRPSPRVSLLVTNIGGLLTTKSISLRFTATNGTVQIDDVYVDPWVST
jgi:hypothetical protein